MKLEKPAKGETGSAPIPHPLILKPFQPIPACSPGYPTLDPRHRYCVVPASRARRAHANRCPSITVVPDRAKSRKGYIRPFVASDRHLCRAEAPAKADGPLRPQRPFCPSPESYQIKPNQAGGRSAEFHSAFAPTLASTVETNLKLPNQPSLL